MTDYKMLQHMQDARKELINAVTEECLRHSTGLYDMSDLGNVIGLTVAKYFVDDPSGGFDREAFMSGLKHGYSLVDGTH